MRVFELTEGDSPLIISVPHAGTFVPADIAARFTAATQALPDTDWNVDRLYRRFAQAHSATMIRANYSRYVVDLNRPPDDTPLYPGQAKISLCPDKTFGGDDIYREGQAPDAAETQDRLRRYWKPYHDELSRQIARIVKKHGFAVLYDAHSIRRVIPRLFDGALPELNLGTVNGTSCASALESAALAEIRKSSYSAVANGRFIGGYITRHYGRPGKNVHALQMELAQTTYMDEQTFAYDEARAARLIPILERVLHTVADNGGAGIVSKTI